MHTLSACGQDQGQIAANRLKCYRWDALHHDAASASVSASASGVQVPFWIEQSIIIKKVFFCVWKAHGLVVPIETETETETQLQGERQKSSDCEQERSTDYIRVLLLKFMNWTYYLVNNTDWSDLIVDLSDTPSSIVLSISAALWSSNWQIKSGLSIRSVFIVYCFFLENLYIYLDVFVVSFHLCLPNINVSICVYIYTI